MSQLALTAGVIFGAAFAVTQFVVRLLLGVIVSIPDIMLAAIEKTLSNTWHRR